MSARIFIPCLNKQRKLYNCNIGSLVGSVFSLIIVGGSKGALWGLGAAGIGFALGNWFSNEWYEGGVQRLLYWHLPFANKWLDPNIPESSAINEL